MVIYGLTDYLKATGELHPNMAATVLVQRLPVLTKKNRPGHRARPAGLTLDESRSSRAFNHIRVVTTGQGRLYYTRVNLLREESSRRPVILSLNILREYFKLAPAKDGEKIVYDLAPLTGPRHPATPWPCA